MVSRLILLRHGLTEGNLKRWFYGGVDIPLTEKGERMLRLQKDRGTYPELPEDAQFFTTGMGRTAQTLEVIYGDVEHDKIKELREMEFGSFECKSYEEMKEDPDFEKWVYDTTGEVRPPGGENRKEFTARVSKGLKKLLDRHRMKEWSHRHGGEDAVTVCVCHGGVISAMMHEMFPEVNNNMWDWIPDPGLGYIVEFAEGEPTMYESVTNIKKLGFGLMRLPKFEDKTIDVEHVKKMVDAFMEKGYTYFDTAFAYDGSEEAIREALVERYPRESFILATKLAAFFEKNEEDAKAQFETSLERTGAGYFDYYLLHNLGVERTQCYEDWDIWGFVRQLKREGKIKNMGFSIHDKADVLEDILKKHGDDVDFVQLQINYADWDDPAVDAGNCYEVARKYGKPIVIMEPVRGGGLADLPEPVAKILKEAAPDKSQASWAIRFCMELPGVIAVLSGMSDLDQMMDNLAIAEEAKPFTAEEKKALEEAVKVLKSVPSVPCTRCNYCVKGCPQEINIPGVFRALNNYNVYQLEEGARGNYSFETRKGGKAKDCIECGACESACPQAINIIEKLKEASEIFD